MISFNNIPTTIRTPGAYAEIDNSRALQGLAANPHKVLIIGQGLAAGTIPLETLVAITRDNLANGYFGTGSELARMCNVFKMNNQNTELWAIRVSAGAGAHATAQISLSVAMSGLTELSVAGTVHMMLNGVAIDVPVTALWSAADVGSAIEYYATQSAYSHLPMRASYVTTSTKVCFSAVNSGTGGNYLDIRFNYFDGDSWPRGFVNSIKIFSAMGGGAGNCNLDDVWTVIENEHFNYIVQPYIDATNLGNIEDELSDRYGALIDKQGIGFTCVRATQASATTLGNTRNSPHNCILAVDASPSDPCEWAAAMGAVAATYLNNDPARPLQFLQLKGVRAPATGARFTRSERDILLYDGISTYIIDSGGNVLLERIITTYQANALGLPDWSYLDVCTMATLAEIRYQFKTRMANRFIIPRFKLADDGQPVFPGSYTATPSTVRSEIVSLFTMLRDRGLIENLTDFIDNLIVERDLTDRTRVNVLLPPDLINQFVILAGQVQFIL